MSRYRDLPRPTNSADPPTPDAKFRPRMRASMASAVLAAWTMLCGALAPAAADTLDGLSAFTQGQYAEALQEWRDAADHGDANGAFYVGTMYDAGIGVHENYAQALQWYKRAAKLGSAVATFNVGVMYDAGKGVAADPAEAAIWYGQAAQRGYARADYNLALLYQDGIGVKRDHTRAARLFQVAAQRAPTWPSSAMALPARPRSRPMSRCRSLPTRRPRC
jgi:TPR repeat protein